MIRENGFQNFAHPERRHLIEFHQFRHDPEAAAVHYSKGFEIDCVLGGDLDEAMAAYHQALELDSHYSEAYMRLGNIFAKRDQLDKAIAYHQQATGLHGWHLCGERDYRFTDNWFSENIPFWEKYLTPFAHRAALQVLEIGSYQGMSTCWLLDNILTDASAKIVCVDPFWPPYGQRFNDNVYDTGALSKVVKIANRSQDALPILKPNAYDFIYIDGDHDDNIVFQDGVFAWNLVKVGGLMIFDDYNCPLPEHNTKMGTDRFTTYFSSSVEVVHRGYQVFLRKTSNHLDGEALSSLQGVLPQAMLTSLAV